MLSISDRCAIALRAASLDDRLSWYSPHAPTPVATRRATPTVAVDVLAAWQQMFSPGDPDSFTRRLAWEGLDPAAVSAAAAVDGAPPRTAPAWTSWLLRFAQQASALARDLETLGLPAESGWLSPKEDPPFVALWIPIVRAMRVELASSCRELARELTTPVRHAIERQWLRDIRSVAERSADVCFQSFTLDGHAERSSDGGSRAERGRAFATSMLHDGLAPLFDAYPVLARLLATLAHTGVDATRELIVRLDADRPLIVETFANGHDPGALVALEPGLSDPHDGRRRVAALRFASGLRLVYKPRDVALERAWNDALTWTAAQGLPSAPPALTVLARDGYGWMAYASHEPCRTVDEVRAYYRAAGALLCLSWIFGGRDLHMENIVATRRGPVIVDAEMLLQPAGRDLFRPQVERPSPEESTPDARDDNRDGCLDTGLLSLFHGTSDGRLIDIGGLRGGSHDPHVVRLDGAVQTPEAFADELVRGFEEAYRFAMARVEMPSADGFDTALARFARCRARVACRVSEQYAALQRAVTAPRYLQSGVLRSCALDAINRVFNGAPDRPRVWPLVEAERRALERLDIPRFTVRADDTSVEQAPHAGPLFARSGLAAVRDRLMRLSTSDLARQTDAIAAVLRQSVTVRFSSAPPPVAGPSDALRADENRDNRAAERAVWIDHAIWIGRELLHDMTANTRFACDAGDANASERSPIERHALYDGTIGPAIFFAALRAATGDATWSSAAHMALTPLRAWLDTLPRDAGSSRAAGPRPTSLSATLTAPAPLPIGACSGIASIVYGLTTVSHVLRDPSYAALAWRASELLTRQHIASDRVLDVANGSAGAILALLALAPTPDERDDHVIDHLMACGDHLVRTQVPRPAGGGAWRSPRGGCYVGFAHGAAGIAYALTRLHARIDRPAYAQAAERAFAFVRSQLAPARRNWPVLDPSGDDAPLVPTWMQAWCHGAPGIVLAQALAARDSAVAEGEAAGGELVAALGPWTKPPDAPIETLCCGNTGRAEVLLTVGQALDDPTLVEAARAITSAIVMRARARGHLRLKAGGPTYPIRDAGFFQGLSGIGYHLLRLAAPDTLPAVLAFDAPPARIAHGHTRPTSTRPSYEHA